MKPVLIADYGCVTGENPLYHPDEGRIYWTDIPAGRLFTYDLASGQHEQCYEGDVVGGFTVQDDGGLLLFMAKGAVRIWRDGALTMVMDEIPEERDSRFNDVIADPMGRVFCGTMPTETQLGSLYRLNPNGSLTRLLGDIGCSNGMGFTLDRKQMYYTDSVKHEIYRFDYDQRTGELSNQQVFVRLPDDLGIPDGMTVDAEGYVWSAIWGGGCMIRFAPDGTEDRRVTFPARKVSCVTFGGPDYDDMYVTTAGGNNKSEEGPGAGGLFHLRLGIRGMPEFRSKIGL